MTTSVRETVLAWAKSRLDTIAGYTVLRNPAEDDLFARLPALIMLDGGEEPVDVENDEQAWSLEITCAAVIRAVGADSGETAGTALSNAVAAMHNALMASAHWDSPVRAVKPGPRPQIEFVTQSDAAEDVVALGAVFNMEYATDAEDAFASSL
jgi:hypothetical protein